MTSMPEPNLRFGLICERVLEEKDGALSIIRIIDRMEITIQGAGLPDQLPPGLLEIVVAMGWIGGLGEHQAAVRVVTPSGEHAETPAMPFFLDSLDRGRNMITKMQVPIRQQGIYWVEFLLNGEPKSRVPFRVIYHRVETPASGVN